jgi:hypothetical protein
MTYTLACVCTGAHSWPVALDKLIAFRRGLRDQYRLPVTAEIKANYLLRNKGAFFRLGLNEATRQEIYLKCMRLQPEIPVKTFALVIDKEKLAQRKPDADPREVAWEFFFQRIERTSQRLKRPAMIVHDEGESATIRKIARKARRAGTAGSHFGTGQLRRPAKQLIDDPVPRDSRQSYFIQLADLNAYAAFRRIFPPPERDVQIVAQETWDELGTARFGAANYLTGDVRGIVVYPR